MPFLMQICVRSTHRMWVLMAVTLPMVVGCHKVLFPQNEPRTQYQKTDTLRDKFTPLQEPDVFGNPKPALRARLSPPT
jgi:hypothetical protein